MKTVFALCILTLVLGEVLEFNNKAVDKIMGHKNTALFLFLSDLTKPDNIEAHSALKEYDKT